MTFAIEVENLTKTYGRAGSGTLAVDRINFQVQQGEIFGFLGPNGAGKTTTQRMLTTLLEPSGGRIIVQGHDLKENAYHAKREIGMVPEESNVYTELSAWDNLMFTASLYRVARRERSEVAQRLLQEFGLWEKRDVKAENFSKGMRRRLSIAMALIHKPKLLFLDEPTPGLDAQSGRTILNLIRQLNAEGATVFLTTHQIEEANQLCDRVAIINHGKIAAIDTPERLKRSFQSVQSVEVALQPSSQAHSQALALLPGVTKMIKTGDKQRLYTQDPPALLPLILEYATAHKLQVVSLSTLSPSLEDVFLQITGGQLGTGLETPEKPMPHMRGKGGRQ